MYTCVIYIYNIILGVTLKKKMNFSLLHLLLLLQMMVSAHGGLEQGTGGRGVHDGRGPLGRNLHSGPEQLTDRVTGGRGRR